VFLEAGDELFRKHRKDILVENLEPIREAELRAFLVGRGLSDARITQVIDDLNIALAGREGAERMEEMQLVLEEMLADLDRFGEERAAR